MNDTDFTGRRVLVVGGSSGIGNGIAHGFKERGARVHVWGTRPEAADYEGEDGSCLVGLGYTQVNAASSEAIAAAPLPFEDGLDVLVHSQGAVLYGRKEFQPTGWDKVMAVNLDSIMHISMRLHEQLAASKGSVIVVSSIGAFRSTVANPAYAASKAGAVSLVRTLGQAWAGEGIRVNGIAPSLVDTKMTKVTMDHMPSPGDIKFFHTDVIPRLGEEVVIYYYQDSQNNTHVSLCTHTWFNATMNCTLRQTYNHTSHISAFTSAYF